MNYNLVLFNNSHFENRCPLYDYRLTEWLVALPPELRVSKPFHKAAIHRAAPRLSLIPTDKAYELPTPHRWLREIHSLADRAGRKLARPLGLGYPRLTLNADYETYVRGELWAWAEELLCGERTSSRGIFRPEALRSLLDRHAAGREEWTIGKFASIMTFEMFMRRFFDQA